MLGVDADGVQVIPYAWAVLLLVDCILKRKSTKVQTLGELRMRGTAN